MTSLFFFSSRRRHTRWPRDWSSDVCSSDLDASGIVHGVLEGFGHYVTQAALINVAHGEDVDAGFLDDFPFLGVEIGRASCRESVSVCAGPSARVEISGR